MHWLVGILLFALAGSSTEAPSLSDKPLWTANLTEDFGFERFDREINKNWLPYQGVVFLSPERIAVYQLNRRSERVKLSPRNESGGAGNFYLQIEILNVRDGHEVGRLELPSPGLFSGVMPSRNGKFIVRTGDMIRLYSASLQQIASHHLLLQKGESQAWEVTVSDSGDTLVAVRRPMYADPASGDKPSYVEVLDAGTLQLKNTFQARGPAGWLTTVGERRILSLAPVHGWQWNIMDMEGHSDRFDPSLSPLTRFGYRRIGLLAHDYLAVYGDQQLVVMSSPTQAVLKLSEPRQFFQLLVHANEFIAVEVLERPPYYKNGMPLLPHFAQIDAYDLNTQAKIHAIERPSRGLYFAISRHGDLGIIAENRLEVLRGAREPE